MFDENIFLFFYKNYMKQNSHTSAFTLVELVVVATILIILATIGFAAYSDNIPDARDAERKASFANIQAAMKLYKKERWAYPRPGAAFNIVNGNVTNIVAYQGKLDTTVSLSTLDRLPIDPKTKQTFVYSTTKSRWEYQIAGTLENGDQPKAIVQWDYKSVARNILPTIVLAADAETDISTEKSKFLFDGSIYNIPYDIVEPYTPISDDTKDINSLLTDGNVTFWQNSDFRSCEEIIEANKFIGDWEYQILDSDGNLGNITCTVTP